MKTDNKLHDFIKSGREENGQLRPIFKMLLRARRPGAEETFEERVRRHGESFVRESWKRGAYQRNRGGKRGSEARGEESVGLERKGLGVPDFAGTVVVHWNWSPKIGASWRHENRTGT